MKLIKSPVRVLGLGLPLAAVLLLVLFHALQSGKPTRLAVIDQLNGGRPHDVENTSGSMASRFRDMATARRRMDLELLKDRWLAQKDSDRDGKMTIALAEESAQRLSCSDQLGELLIFLGDNEMAKERRCLMDKVSSLFSSARASDARLVLCQVKSLAFRQFWSFEAGMYCPVDDLDAFQDALTDRDAARNAGFGRCVSQAKSDPVDAWQSALKLLSPEFYAPSFGPVVDANTDIVPDWSATTLERIAESASEPSDLHDMVSALPNVPRSLPALHPLKRVRFTLLSRWASYEPSAATDYILGNLSDLDPSDIGPVAHFTTDSNWIDAHVPKGPYYDYLIDAILDGMEDVETPEFRSLAERIGDPKRRGFNLSRISRDER